MTRAPLAIAVPALAAALAVAHPAPAQATTHTPERVIASSTAHELRFNIVAKETSGGSAPTASVYVMAYDHTSGSWRRLDWMHLGAKGSYFWDTVTGPHAIKDFSITNSDPRGGSVRVLVSPALGFSPTYHFQLHNGRFVR
jgi:hypothetical protein